eukprot:TRINITY_DN3744_c0_g2_i1.p1 TRINITY_DN3744_c0_g2~~TRINITY_DN3744_c0_g2_i1.p1  ORF type:complete len:424 (+),score=64.77 TRINITY_DN3744_c0_g2_i1:74-1345(+)
MDNDIALEGVISLLKELGPAAVSVATGAMTTRQAMTMLESAQVSPVMQMEGGATQTETSPLGRVLSVAGVLAGAVVTMAKVLPKIDWTGAETDPNVAKGKKLIETEQYTEAIKCFDAAIQEDPAHENAYNNRAVAYFYLEMYQMCVEDCTQQIEVNPKHQTESLSNKALALEMLNNLEESVTAWTGAIDTTPEQKSHLYIKRGTVLIKLAAYEEAVKDFETSLEIDDTAEAHAGIADALLRAHGPGSEKCLKEINKAIEMSPDCAEFYGILGRAYAKTDLKRAFDAFSKAIQLDVDNSEAYLNRGFINRANGQTEAALRDLSNAIRTDEKCMVAYCERADIISMNAANLDAHMQAIREIETALRIEESWIAYNTRATIYHRMDRQNAAVQDYTKALRILQELGGEGGSEYSFVLQNLETAQQG